MASAWGALTQEGVLGESLSVLFLISEAHFLVKPLLPLQQTLSQHTGKPGFASSNPESLCGWETLAKSQGFSGFLCPTFGCKIETLGPLLPPVWNRVSSARGLGSGWEIEEGGGEPIQHPDQCGEERA